MYQVNGLLKHFEENNYENGCLPETGGSSTIDYTFQGKTQKKVIDEICDLLGIEESERKNDYGFLLNACDEKGRIDFQTLENADSQVASRQEIEQWKQGKTKLYHCNYSCMIEKTETIEAKYI